MSHSNSLRRSQSDYAYFRALRKAKVFQQLTDATASTDFADDVYVELNKDAAPRLDVQPILAKAKEVLGAVKEIMAFELDDDDLSTSSALNPSHDSTGVFLTDAAFKFWFVILLICFLFISVGIFHFFCIGQKNVTRRNSLDKNSREATETTTMEMVSEEIEMDEEEQIVMTTSSVIQDF